MEHVLIGIAFGWLSFQREALDLICEGDGPKVSEAPSARAE